MSLAWAAAHSAFVLYLGRLLDMRPIVMMASLLN